MPSAVRSAPGSKTDPTMAQLRELRDRLVAEQSIQSARPGQSKPSQGKSKSARKRAAKRDLRAGSDHVEIGATRPGECPKFNTGSIQALPSSGKISRGSGMRLKVMQDYVPGRPGDWTDPKRRNMPAASPAVLKPHWSRNIPERDGMDFERANRLVRSTQELASMHADGVSGALEIQTGAVRHESDVATGVFRDSVGRVVRTLDMPDVECKTVRKAVTIVERGRPVQRETEYYTPVDGAALTPRELAVAAGVPGTRTLTDMINERASERAAVTAANRDEREARRAERKAEQSRIKQVRAEARQEESEAREQNRAASKKLRDLAREILAKQGVERPTPLDIRRMLEFFEVNMQRAEYAGLSQRNVTVAA